MNFKKISNLCSPAKVFLFIELLLVLTMTYQNWGYSDYMLCFGDYTCDVDNKKILLIPKLLYIAFWTFILDLMCKNGYKNFAWMLLFLPVILFIIFMFLFMLLKGARRIGLEGLENNDNDLNTLVKNMMNTQDEVDKLILKDRLKDIKNIKPFSQELKTKMSENKKIRREVRKKLKE